TKPPFNNPDVRKAIQHGLDRKALNQLWLQGEGQPAYGFWPQDHPNFAPDLVDKNNYDPDQAKRLLQAAGVTGTTLDIWYSASPDYERLGEVLQSQLSALGVTAKLHGSPTIYEEYIQPQLPGAMYVPGSRSGVDKVLQIFGQGSVQNLCGADRTDIA